MNSFILSEISSQVQVRLCPNLTKDQLLQFPAFGAWVFTLQKSLALQLDPMHPFHRAAYSLRSIEVQACDYLDKDHLGFVKLKAIVSNDKDERLPANVFLRGGSVAMLLILQSTESMDNEEHTILTVQPRIPVGSLSFIEIPAGILDDSGAFSGPAAKEIKEETGLEIEGKELIDMTAMALQAEKSKQKSGEVHLQDALYPSPGGCDEYMPVFLARKIMTKQEMDDMRGRLTGLRKRGEKIGLKICRLADLWKVGARDAKTLAALALYEGLKREGKV